jgi:hypothetical protein
MSGSNSRLTSQDNTWRRALAPEAMGYLEELVHAEPVLESSFPLMTDTSVLFEGARYPSVVVLAVIDKMRRIAGRLAGCLKSYAGAGRRRDLNLRSMHPEGRSSET